MVARLRGAKFVVYFNGGVYNVLEQEGRKIAFDALYEVAIWLGYEDDDEYNKACEEHPRQVFKRLREAV